MVGTAKVPRTAALILGAALVLVGCNDNAGDSAPSPSSTKASAGTTAAATTSKDSEAAIWNPCDLPDSAISALGLNTASKDNTVAGVDPTGWKVCAWQAGAKTYDFTIFSSTHTLEEVQQRSDREGFTPTTVGSHRALQYRVVGDKHQLKCYISAEVPHGMVDFLVVNRYLVQGASEPCAEVRRLSDALVEYLPKG
ncbi:DUF3558 domain-containing protein [Nocardia pseudovaccinii]|uniref:DUF3558 domain-containing protein n=1 Tax=Nocardia pseudovaccinii TaxID=189540 RepID=UPI003D8FDAA0